MDKLANYGSDDDYEDSPQHKRTTEFRATGADDRPPPPPPSSYHHHHPRRSDSSEADVNYEEVQMDLSEDTNSSSSSSSSSSTSSNDSLSKREKQRPPTNDRGGRKDDRSYKQNNDDRYKRNNKDSPKTTTTTTAYKSRRDEDRSSLGKSERFKDKSRPDDKHRRRNSRDRYDRRSRRSSSRDRQRSRSPPPPPPSSSSSSSSRRPDYRNKRSNSRERGGAKSGYTRRFDRASNKMAQLEKLGIEIKTPDCQFMSPLDLQRSMEDQKRKGEMENRFFMPGITGRFREQIERRKMLWQKKEPEKKEAATVAAAAATVVGGSSAAGRVWESTTFAQDSDGKVANKFKRLMGIRGKADETKPATDNLKKQEEMFSSMEAQYEVARTATHTMRGVGLGFGSFQR